MKISHHKLSGTVVLDSKKLKLDSLAPKEKSKISDYLGLLPKLPYNMYWHVVSYAHARGMKRAIDMKLKDFGFVTYLRQSGSDHHLLTESGSLIVCTIGFRTKPVNKLIER